MRKFLCDLALASLALVVVTNIAPPAIAADAPAGKAAHYSVATTQVGTLLDDPAVAPAGTLVAQRTGHGRHGGVTLE
jgi:hypothetical protein